MKIVVDETLQPCDLPLVPGKNLVTGRDGFADRFGDLTSLENDFLLLASSIYAADLACKREEREAFIREIVLQVPLVNHQAFERVRVDIEGALHLLSCDNWTLEFVRSEGAPEPKRKWPEKEGIALLFSGGLDSLSAAVNLLDKNKSVLLTSHITHNRIVKGSQDSIHTELEQLFKRKIPRLALLVFARSLGKYRFPRDTEREESQRTRSFLFLVLASLSARRVGFNRIIYIAENGQFAIHLPLSPARVGPFSTHTGHPEFVFIMQNVFRTVFGNRHLTIENPFLYLTKAEVLGSVPKKRHHLFPLSVSCWRGSRVAMQNHCGECIPCLTRRIALEAQDISYSEYERDLLSEKIAQLPHDDLGKRNLVDLLQFIKSFWTYSSEEKDRLIEKHPELVNEYFDQEKAIDMYSRFAKEAKNVFYKYPNVKPLLA
jgi:7-cyano-7-deazaguanine synthase in queuosine biosynthesis